LKGSLHSNWDCSKWRIVVNSDHKMNGRLIGFLTGENGPTGEQQPTAKTDSSPNKWRPLRPIYRFKTVFITNRPGEAVTRLRLVANLETCGI